MLQKLRGVWAIGGGFILHRLVLVDLHLHTALRGEFGDEDAICDLLEDDRICFATQAIVVRMKVSSSDDVR